MELSSYGVRQYVGLFVTTCLHIINVPSIFDLIKQETRGLDSFSHFNNSSRKQWDQYAD